MLWTLRLMQSIAKSLSLSRLPRECCQVILQEACLLHKYSRVAESETEVNDAEIVERPLRLRAAQVGIAAVHVRHNTLTSFNRDGRNVVGAPFDILFSTKRLALDSEAVLFIHDRPLLSPTDTEASNLLPYPFQLKDMIQQVKARHAARLSEIPAHLSQTDLYLDEGSLEAIEGALGAIVQGIDSCVNKEGLQTRFVSIRPPGHHCGASSASGFCFINNVCVGAAHAYLEHDFDRVVIFDIDLHHGNGTQAIAWTVNELASRSGNLSKVATPKSSPGKANAPSKNFKRKRPLKICYTSLHDILSYPCEDADPTLVANASMTIDGAHGQYLANVHLEQYSSVAQFHSDVYPRYRQGLLGAAESFLRKAQADSAKTLFFISAGFDASEHEYPSMSRHNRRVPTSFYSRFAQDLKEMVSKPSVYHTRAPTIHPKIVAVLEGGYSDRAISSGIASLLSGLITSETPLDFDLKDITLMEKACFPTPPSARKSMPEWALKTGQLFGHLSQEDRSAWDNPKIATPKESPVQPIVREKRQVKAPIYYREESPVVSTRIKQSKNVSTQAALVLPENGHHQPPPESGSSSAASNLQVLVKEESSASDSDANTQITDSTSGTDDVKPSIRLVWQGAVLHKET